MRVLSPNHPLNVLCTWSIFQGTGKWFIFHPLLDMPDFISDGDRTPIIVLSIHASSEHTVSSDRRRTIPSTHGRSTSLPSLCFKQSCPPLVITKNPTWILFNIFIVEVVVKIIEKVRIDRLIILALHHVHLHFSISIHVRIVLIFHWGCT
eukprot:TRINITY_DN1475_c0_g1_i5.p2 TRINITY_DN1475_c0_g1~~TRINITY_DN1475_c0_g1_i5.p2  ORF type:complete len:150 (+),score=4.33 TRINITY_DN1475_c0_g1_i5:683-1132(+)